MLNLLFTELELTATRQGKSSCTQAELKIQIGEQCNGQSVEQGPRGICNPERMSCNEYLPLPNSLPFLHLGQQFPGTKKATTQLPG
jgi:hypothetical protein